MQLSPKSCRGMDVDATVYKCHVRSGKKSVRQHNFPGLITKLTTNKCYFPGSFRWGKQTVNPTGIWRAWKPKIRLWRPHGKIFSFSDHYFHPVKTERLIYTHCACVCMLSNRHQRKQTSVNRSNETFVAVMIFCYWSICSYILKTLHKYRDISLLLLNIALPRPGIKVEWHEMHHKIFVECCSTMPHRVILILFGALRE